MANEQSRVLTLVFTDLADSTALKSERGDAEVRDLILRHRDLVTRLAEECSGRVIDWAGDGCFLTFETSTAGVLFTLRLQQAHSDEPDLPGVRVGIHLGEITESPGPDNTVRIEGLAVDVAARVSGLSKPGQVLMSASVYDSARQRMGVEAMGMPLLWQLHGTYALKGFDKPLEIGEAGIEGVARLEAPKASEKAQLIQRAKKQPQQFKQHSSTGVPLWAVGGIVLVLVAVIGYLVFERPGAPSSTLTPADTRITAIAVLPFDNFSGDETQDYFVNGMTDTLTAELAKIKSIKVMARTSAMRYKGTDKTPDEIARELGVEGLIEGSIQRTENEVRITAQLIDGRTNEHVWAGNFDGTVENILRLQGEVAIAIAEELDAVLAPEERAELEQADDVNPAAWELYLQAREAWRPRTKEGFAQAIALLTGAIAADPNFAEAHALLGLVHATRPMNYDDFLSSDDFQLAREMGERALQLDPNSVEARFALAWAAMPGRWDWQAFERHLRAALDIDPNNAYAYVTQGLYFQLTGYRHRAIESLERAVELDPLRPVFLWNLSAGLVGLGDYEQALAAQRRVLEISPNSVQPIANIPRILALQGKREEAISALPPFSDVPTENELATHAIVYAILGMREDATKVLNEYASRYSALPIPFPALAFLGREPEALKSLNLGVEIHSQSSINHMQSYAASAVFIWENPRTWEIYASANVPHFPPEHPAYENQQRWLADEAAKRVLAAQPKPVRRLSITLNPPLAARVSGSQARNLEISQDGRILVYRAFVETTTQLYLRRLDELRSQPIFGTEGSSHFAVSPDGEWVAFNVEQHFRVSRLGTPEIRDVVTLTELGSGLDWSEDGSLYVGGVADGILRIPVDGGPPTLAYRTGEGLRDEVTTAYVRALPNGRDVLYNSAGGGSIGLYRIAVTNSESGETSLLIPESTRPEYAPSGHLVSTRRGGLVAVPYSLADARTTGEPVFLTLNDMAGVEPYPIDWSIADDGTLVYARSGSGNSSGLEMPTWVDRAGNEEPAVSEGDYHRVPRLSPDGTRLVSVINDNIWVQDLRSQRSVQLTFGGTLEFSSVWSNDGEYIYFRSTRDSGMGIYRIRSDGSELPETVLLSQQGPTLHSMSRDGSRLYVSGRVLEDADVPERLGVATIDLATGKATGVLSAEYHSTGAVESIDGQWLAFATRTLDGPAVYIAQLEDVGRRWPVHTDGGTQPVWHPNGRTLLFVHRVDGVDTLMSVDVELGVPPVIGPAQAVFEADSGLVSLDARQFDMAPDGERFLVLKPEIARPAMGASELIVVENWFEELQRLAPRPEAN